MGEDTSGIRGKTRSGRPPAFPLPVIAGLDDQPANSWKRLACGQNKDDEDEDADLDWTQTTSLATKLPSHTCDVIRRPTLQHATQDFNHETQLTASLWSTHLELVSDTSC